MGDGTCNTCGIIIRVGIRGVKLRFLLTIFVLCLFMEYRVSVLNYEIKIKRNAPNNMYLLIFLFRNNTHSFSFLDQLLKYPENVLSVNYVRSSVQYGRTRVYFHIDNSFLFKTID